MSPASVPATRAASPSQAARTAPPSPTALRGRSAERPHRLLPAMSQAVASHLVLAVTGLVSLPLLTRNLGPALYGSFSVFLTVLGVITYQDFARQMLVVEGANADHDPRDLDALTRASRVVLGVLALGVGWMVLPPAGAAALFVAVLLHTSASRRFARLSNDGRVGSAVALRNLAWAAATVMVCALSFLPAGRALYAWPFAAANLFVLWSYARLTPRSEERPTRSDPLGWRDLVRSPHWSRYRSEIRDMLGFTLAASVIVALDRIVLEHMRGADELGRYVAQGDLALRMNTFGTALAGILLPMMAGLIASQGRERAAQRMVQLGSRIVAVTFVCVLVLLLCEDSVVRWILGADFVQGPRIYGLMLVGVFLQTLGYVITPWQRAQGDFRSQRRAYQLGAVAMTAVALVAIPLWGAIGAVLSVLAARSAELVLFAGEIRRTKREVLPRWRVAVALSMFLVVSTLAGSRFFGGLQP